MKISLTVAPSLVFAAALTSLTHAQITYSSTDTPLNIPPGAPGDSSGTTISTITVGDSGTIEDVDVAIDMNHTFAGDLVIDVTSPAGTSVKLTNGRWKLEAAMRGTYTFDDEAANAYPGPGDPMLAQDYQPFALLDAFDGEDINGDWTLTIYDQWGGDIGTLNGWDLIATSIVTSLFDPAAGQLVGSLAQTGIQNGSYQFQLLNRNIQYAAAAMAAGGGLNVVTLPAPSGSMNYADDVEGMSSVLANDSGQTRANFQIRGQNSALLSGAWDGWVSGYGIGGQVGSDGAVAGLDYAAGGTQMGLCRLTQDDSLIGLFGNYGVQNIAMDNGDKGHVDSGVLGAFLYRGCDCGGYYVAAANATYDSYATRRSTATGTARGSFDGAQAGMYLERAWERCWRGRTVQPYVALQYIWLHQNDFTETGAGVNNATVNDTYTNSLRCLLGAKLPGQTRTILGGFLTPEARVYWMHEFLDATTGVTSSVGGAPAFATGGLNLGRDWAVLGAGLTYDRGGRAALYANYDLQANGRQAFHVGSGGLLWVY